MPSIGGNMEWTPENQENVLYTLDTSLDKVTFDLSNSGEYDPCDSNCEEEDA